MGDLGVCLHYSSSGVDLPMKVVDMFGAGLPALAIKFKSIHELVQHGVHGYIFDDHAQLAAQIEQIFVNYPDQAPLLEKFRENILEFRERSWEQEWSETVLPIISSFTRV